MGSVSEQIANNITQRRLFSPQQSILVAVSGGVDSMVLLRVLHQLSRESGWKLTIAHVNHQLRGASSLADERLVRRAAAGLKLPIVVSRLDVRRYAKTHRLSLEMGARKVRHDFLARIAVERNIPCVALAHHLDDQVELFFLRLFRGSGSQGLAGMKWTNPSPSNPAVPLVRPLLNCAKTALREYALEWQIEFREDASNNSLDIQRNRVRHELLPLLEQSYQTGIGRSVSRVMDILAAESEFVNIVAEAWRARRSGGQERANSSGTILGLECTFEGLPVAVQRRCLHLELVSQGVTPGYDLVEHLRLQPGRPIEVSGAKASVELLSGENPQGSDSVQEGSSVRLVRKPEGIVRVRPVVTVPFRLEGCNLNLQEGPGELDWEGVRFQWRVSATKGAQRPGASRQIEFFDADAVGDCIVLRHWRTGDRFQPIGMARAVKLQDLFVNQKVPRERRRNLAVAATIKGELFWVEGLRISERFKLTNATIRRLHWAWQRL